jgi:hypothetical protein
MMKVNNRAELIEELAKMLQQYDKDLNKYQTDVYLYIDENGNGTLDEFVNVGGNSWKNDDHITIYSDQEHYETMYDWYTESGDLAWGLGMEWEELKQQVLDWLVEEGAIEPEDIDDYDYEPEYAEVLDYIKENDSYVEQLTELYEAEIDANMSDYMQRAEDIFYKNEEEDW